MAVTGVCNSNNGVQTNKNSVAAKKIHCCSRTSRIHTDSIPGIRMRNPKLIKASAQNEIAPKVQYIITTLNDQCYRIWFYRNAYAIEITKTYFRLVGTVDTVACLVECFLFHFRFLVASMFLACLFLSRPPPFLSFFASRNFSCVNIYAVSTIPSLNLYNITWKLFRWDHQRA